MLNLHVLGLESLGLKLRLQVGPAELDKGTVGTQMLDILNLRNYMPHFVVQSVVSQTGHLICTLTDVFGKFHMH